LSAGLELKECGITDMKDLVAALKLYVDERGKAFDLDKELNDMQRAN
jgi:hypothetical protein